MKLQRTILGVAILAWLNMCAPAAAAAAISITNAWARATPGGTTSCAVYLDIASAVADRVTGAYSPIATRAELHLHRLANGIITMRAIDGINLTGGKTFSFAPMGYHIMLTGLKAPLRAGDHFPLTLTFAHNGDIVTDILVKPIGDRYLPPAGQSMAAMPGMGDMGAMK